MVHKFNIEKKRFGVKEYYKFYKTIQENKQQIVLPYELFKDVIESFFKEATNCIIKSGGRLRLPYRLGDIVIKRFDKKIQTRDGVIKKAPINWGATKKHFKEKGVWKYIMFNESDYILKWDWEKSKFQCPQKRYYRFKATASSSKTQKNRTIGAKEQLYNFVTENNTNYLIYEYHKSFLVDGKKKLRMLNCPSTNYY